MQRGWFRDTLAKRLFGLMWVSLVLSHLVAHQIVMGFIVPAHPTIAGLEDLSIPSLPPIQGSDMARNGRQAANDAAPPSSSSPNPGGPPPRELRSDGPPPPPDGFGAGDGPPPRPDGSRAGEGPPGAGGSNLPTPLPARALFIDYVIRIAVIALCSLLGSRWLAVPMRRLVDASATLSRNLGQASPAPELDERRGTVEVREAASVFNAMARQLSEQFRSRELLVAALSHDLRTPLTRIRIRLEPMPDSQERTRSIADIHEMDALIDESMAVFRDVSQAEPLKKTDVLGLSQSIVDDAVEARHEASLTGEAAVVMAKPMALRRVVSNLVSNAIRYGGRAMVTVRLAGEGVEVLVEDDGPGIPEHQLENVLQPFFRLESSRSRATGGSGLGLFIARDLLVKQGGRLSLTNRPTGGLRATVWLPRVR